MLIIIKKKKISQFLKKNIVNIRVINKSDRINESSKKKKKNWYRAVSMYWIKVMVFEDVSIFLNILYIFYFNFFV